MSTQAYDPARGGQGCCCDGCCSRGSGCGGCVTPRQKFLLGMGSWLIGFGFLFCIPAISTVWAKASATYNFNYGSSFDRNIDWTLWVRTITIEDDDDTTRMKKSIIEEDEAWRAVEFGRGVVLMVLFTVIPMGIFYCIVSCIGGQNPCRTPAVIEVVAATVFLVLGILAFASTGNFAEAWKKELDDDGFDDTTECTGGCALNAFNGCMLVAISVVLFYIGVHDLTTPLDSSYCECCCASGCCHSDFQPVQKPPANAVEEGTAVTVAAYQAPNQQTKGGADIEIVVERQQIVVDRQPDDESKL